MKNKIKIMLLFLIFSVLIYSKEYQGEYEEGYIEFQLNKIVLNTFFPVFVDLEEDEPYIGLRNLFILGGSNAMEFERESKLFKGKIGDKNVEFFYGDSEYIVGEQDIFVKGSDLEKVIDLKKWKWDVETYKYSLETNFELPYEIYLKAQDEQIKLENQENKEIDPENVYKGERSLVSPGVLTPRASWRSLNDEDFNLSLRYDTQLLYGDFTANYEVEPDSDLSTVRLRYTEILEEKRIVLGDTFIRTYDFLNASSVRGAAIEPWEIGGTDVELGRTNINGFAPPGTTVELYRNGSLVTFLRVGNDSQYEFNNIEIESYRDNFEVKIYNFDGTIDSRSLDINRNRNILSKGEIDYRGAVGESQRDNEPDDTQYHFKGFYGMTDRLTLGLGYMELVSEVDQGSGFFTIDEDIDDDDREFILNNRLIDTSFYYTTGPKKYPINLEVSNLYDMDNSDNTHVVIYRQEFGNNTLNLDFYEFSETNSIITGNERTYSGSWSGDIDKNWSYNLFYGKREELDLGATETVGGNVFYNKENISHSIGISRSFGEEEFTALNYSYTNSGLELFNIPYTLVGRASIDVEDPSENALYSVTVRNRGNSRWDVSMVAESDTEDYRGRLEVSYKATGWLELLSGFSFGSEDDTEAYLGFEAEKSIKLERITKKEEYPMDRLVTPSPTDSWILGKVFLDIDGDGILDENEVGMEDVAVKIGRKEGVTNSSGYYFIDGVPSYDVDKLEIDDSTIDPLLNPKYKKEYIMLYPAKGEKVDIPLQPMSIVMGDVKLLGNKRSSVEDFVIISNLKVIVKNKEGKLIKEESVKPEGFFMIEKLLPGEYTLEIVYNGNYLVEFKRETYNLEIKAGEYGDYYEGFDFEVLSFTSE